TLLASQHSGFRKNEKSRSQSSTLFLDFLCLFLLPSFLCHLPRGCFFVFYRDSYYSFRFVQAEHEYLYCFVVYRCCQENDSSFVGLELCYFLALYFPDRVFQFFLSVFA